MINIKYLINVITYYSAQGFSVTFRFHIIQQNIDVTR